MKRTLLATLSALTLTLVAAPAFANEVVAIKQDSLSNVREITPVDLVTRSYQGSFTDQGIPSFGAFVKATRAGRVTAEDLVKGAIASGRLAPETINDRAYLNNVNAQLSSIDND